MVLFYIAYHGTVGWKMAEEGFVNFMAKMDEKQLRELLEGTSLITDPLGQELIGKASGPNLPINVEELPTIRKGLRDEALARLYKLEKLGILKSSFAPMNGRTERVFSITDFGRKMVLQH